MGIIRILGVDPGSRLTGFGVVDLVGTQLRFVAQGTLRLSNTGGRAVIPLEQRLLLIHQGLSAVIQEHRPTIMSVERVFFAKNAVSALKLGQARGAAILSGAIHQLEIVEYSPSEVKASLVGHGQADKTQVARMVEFLLKTKLEFATSDASDGLALAVCHARVMATGCAGSALSQAMQPSAKMPSGSSRRKKMSLAESVGAYERMGIPKRR